MESLESFIRDWYGLISLAIVFGVIVYIRSWLLVLDRRSILSSHRLEVTNDKLESVLCHIRDDKSQIKALWDMESKLTEIASNTDRMTKLNSRPNYD